MSPADSASRAGATPETSGDSSSGTFGRNMKKTALQLFAIALVVASIALAFYFNLRNSAISKEQAINFAAQYVKKHHPEKDISRRPPVAKYTPPLWPFGKILNGGWAVTFGVPPPPHYSRPLISYHVFLDRTGKVDGPLITTSP